jgi:hypothetical protein
MNPLRRQMELNPVRKCAFALCEPGQACRAGLHLASRVRYHQKTSENVALG